jgi:hypothetical protein
MTTLTVKTLPRDLIDNERFVAAYLTMLASLHDAGSRSTINYLDDIALTHS